LNTSLVTNAGLTPATPEISAVAALTKKSNIANAKQQKELKGMKVFVLGAFFRVIIRPFPVWA
jgi:hypothetical protein